MNAAEQRRQHTVAQRLEQTSESVAVLLDALDARLFDQASKAQETRRDVNTLKADVERLLKEGVYDVATDRMVPLGTIASTARGLAEARSYCDERWLKNTDAQKRLFDLVYPLEALRVRTFWGRLRWLFTGR